MTPGLTAYVGAIVFDGSELHVNSALLTRNGRVCGIVPRDDSRDVETVARLEGGLIAPGFVDLQVNGGGGIMFNDDPSVQTLESLARTHANVGTTSILPTLVTDSRETYMTAIDAACAATAAGVPGILGLHLEGPHLSDARRGAHDSSFIRPMSRKDENELCAAARRLPILKVTVAPESVSNAQIRRLAAAGVLVSLGHSDATYAEAIRAAESGARCVTHLFNAMPPMQSREPGLVGAAITGGNLNAGLIADLVHVHPVSIKLAMAAKAGPGRIFLVSDAMATAGSGISGFLLNGRRVERKLDRLVLGDGTLAGAVLDLATAVRNMVEVVGVPMTTALKMATSIPGELVRPGREIGFLAPGSRADFVHLDDRLRLEATWKGGRLIGRSKGNGKPMGAIDLGSASAHEWP